MTESLLFIRKKAVKVYIKIELNGQQFQHFDVS